LLLHGGWNIVPRRRCDECRKFLDLPGHGIDSRIASWFRSRRL
jgi:hypothetical protein